MGKNISDNFENVLHIKMKKHKRSMHGEHHICTLIISYYIIHSMHVFIENKRGRCLRRTRIKVPL